MKEFGGELIYTVFRLKHKELEQLLKVIICMKHLLYKEEHKQLFDLPNWDNEVFKEITGIDAEAEIAKEDN